MEAESEEEGTDRVQLMAHFQEITGIEAEDVITEHLSSHHWNLEAAVQDALNVKEGIRPIFGTMPPSAPLLQFTPPNEPRGGRDVIAGSVQWGTGGRRRMDVMRREGWLEWSMNLAIFPLRFILGVANEMFQLMVSLLFGSEPAPSQTPHEDSQEFVNNFNNEFGSEHPEFMIKSYAEALTQARQDLKFLLVYVHSPGHQDTAWFCRDVLCSQQLREFLAASSIICFGVSVDSAEGVRVSYILRETLYPFLALIVLRHGRMVVCERIEGALSLDEFIERLRTSVADNEAELVVERTNRYRRQEDQQLRESQDQAFEESLAADREKQRRRDEDMWRAKQLAEEEEEEQRREEVMKEEFEVDKALRASRLPLEPDLSDPNAMQVMLKLPSGRRLERRFRDTDKLQSLYDFAYVDQNDKMMKLTLLTNFPRKELVVDSDGGPCLGELQLGKRCALFVQDDTA